MFKLTHAQANAIQELNWIDLNDHDAESRALHTTVGTRKLDMKSLLLVHQDMDFIIERAQDDLDNCDDFGEPRDRIGYVSRVRSLTKLNKKMARYIAQAMRLGQTGLWPLEVTA